MFPVKSIFVNKSAHNNSKKEIDMDSIPNLIYFYIALLRFSLSQINIFSVFGLVFYYIVSQSKFGFAGGWDLRGFTV